MKNFKRVLTQDTDIFSKLLEIYNGDDVKPDQIEVLSDYENYLKSDDSIQAELQKII